MLDRTAGGHSRRCWSHCDCYSWHTRPSADRPERPSRSVGRHDSVPRRLGRLRRAAAQARGRDGRWGGPARPLDRLRSPRPPRTGRGGELPSLRGRRPTPRSGFLESVRSLVLTPSGDNGTHPNTLVIQTADVLGRKLFDLLGYGTCKHLNRPVRLSAGHPAGAVRAEREADAEQLSDWLPDRWLLNRTRDQPIRGMNAG